MAQLERKGKKITIIEPGAENAANNEGDNQLNDRISNDDPDAVNGDQARTGRFGGAKFDGTIKDGY